MSLYYISDNKPELLPEWAYFFMRLGQLIATSNDGYRIIVGLAIPTRAFACGLVAVGIVLAKAGNKNFIDAIQLKYIRDLKPGTPVYIRTDANRKLRGVVKKFGEFNGQEFIFIQTGKSEERGYPLNRCASRITVSEREVKLPKYQKRGHSIEAPSDFLEGCLGKGLAEYHIRDSSFEALLIGKKSVLEKEVNAPLFFCEESGKPSSAGCLQEILRVRQFSGTNRSYRTQWVSSSNISSEKDIGAPPPLVVIFDGAAAYIKLNHQWRSAHQIALLDRTERQFIDAVELLNQNYAYRLEDIPELPIRIPNGIELMAYKASV